jgi:hypothetical protein
LGWISRANDSQSIFWGLSGNRGNWGLTPMAFWKKKYFLAPLNLCKLTKDQARAIEQLLTVQNPNFDNLINSISPKRAWYDEAISWATDWQKQNGGF